MKNTLTTYYARKKSVFLWLAVLCMLISFAARIAFAFVFERSLAAAVFRIVLPLAANIALALCLPLKGEKQFYLTRGPVLLYSLSLLAEVFGRTGAGFGLRLFGLALVLLSSLLYYITFGGKLSSKLPALLGAFLLLGAAFLDRSLPAFFKGMLDVPDILFSGRISDLAFSLGLVFVVLSAKRLPPPKEGEAYRLRPGDRLNGRRIRTIPPMDQIKPYIMVTRNTSSNYIRDRIEISNVERYIREKRRAGLKHFGITHVIIAAYVRACTEMPALNRFIGGQRVFHRFGIVCNMVVKKKMDMSSPDTVIKIAFEPGDNADEVYRKFDKVLESVQTPELDSSFDKLAALLNVIPGLLLKFTVWLLKFLDYFGMMPKIITELSPFHGTFFITSMGSLGIPPIFHHLYDFGDLPQFIAFGCKYTEKHKDENGGTVSRKYIDWTSVSDERIVDGFYYASAMKRIKFLLSHPERLDESVLPVPDIE